MHARTAGYEPPIEQILEPDLPICDAHHHLWHLPAQRYLIEEFLADAGGRHNVETSVYVEAGSFHRTSGPEVLRPVGETEFANGIAAIGESRRYGPTRVAAAIVGFADLARGAGVGETLAAHVAAGGSRFAGVRQSGAWDPHPDVKGGRLHAPANLYGTAKFREGFAGLRAFGLVFDAFVNHPQLADVADLARAFPDQRIVLDHAGGLLGVGPYAGKHDLIFSEWHKAMIDLADCPNVFVKLGGLGMSRCGFGFHKLSERPTSIDLAQTWRPWIETCIELFGARRCMFESNFPVDRQAISYATLWNAFKRIASGASVSDRTWLFSATAAMVYGIRPKVQAAA